MKNKAIELLKNHTVDEVVSKTSLTKNEVSHLYNTEFNYPGRRTRPRFTSDELNDMAQQYQTGKTLETIGDLYKISGKRVRRLLSDQGIQIRNTGGGEKITESSVDQIRLLYKKGHSCQKISELTSISYYTIRSHCSDIMRNAWDYEKKSRLTMNEKDAYAHYRSVVWYHTEKSYNLFINEINPLSENQIDRLYPRGVNKYHIDHIYSVKDGFENDIDPKLISHWTNLRMLWHTKNRKKSRSSDRTLLEFLQLAEGHQK